MEILWQDVRYSVRSLLKTPGPTALVVLLMALGASLTIVVFTFLNAAIFRPLPFTDSDRLVLVKESHPRRGQASLRPANFVDWKSQNECFEAATSSRLVRAELRGPEGVELMEAELALEDYFQVLGVPPLLGRTFEADDYTPTHERAFLDYANATFGGPTVVLSHGFWQRRFGGDPTVLGQALELNDVTLEIVGVMPPFFRGLAGSPTVWIPRVLSAEERAFRESHELFALARLAPGVSLDEATAEMQGLYRNLEQLYPAENQDWTAVLVPFRDEILGDTKLALVLVQLAALLVLPWTYNRSAASDSPLFSFSKKPLDTSSAALSRFKASTVPTSRPKVGTVKSPAIKIRFVPSCSSGAMKSPAKVQPPIATQITTKNCSWRNAASPIFTAMSRASLLVIIPIIQFL